MAGNDIILNVGANLSPAQRQLQGFVTQAQRQLGSQSFQFKLDEKGFRQPLGRITGDLNQFQGAMDASIARTLAFGASVGAIGGVTKAFKDMVAVTANVEHSLKEINILLNLSTKDLKGFSKELFGVAKNTASSFDAVTTAATEFSRQGLSAAETAKRVNNALILTRLSGLGAEASVSALTAAVNGFKSEAITTTEVVNRLANVDAKFAVSSADLAKALSRAGAVSTDAKVKFNELVAATTAVQQATARGGNVIGNGFKTIFTRLQRSKVRQELEKIGVATTTATGTIRGAIDVLTDYAKVYQTLTDQQKAFTSEQVAGVFQINTLKALVGDLANEFGVYNQALQVANTTTNEAVQRNAQLNDTLQSLASQTGTEIAELAAKIGTISFEGNFKGLLGLLKGILGNVNQGLDSEGAGAQIATGIMKGIGSFLSGPGLAIALVGITRLLGFIGKQTTSAIGQVLAIGSQSQKRQVVQQKINALLVEDNVLLKQIMSSSGNIGDINKLVTKSIHDQNRALANQKLLVGEIARGFQITKAGSIGPISGGKRGAEGFVPNLVRSERSSISQGVGGARSGDRPVVIPNFNFGRGAKGTMVAHTGEHIVPNFAGGGSAIFNRNMVSSMGLPRGAKRVAARGFVPNFATDDVVEKIIDVSDGDSLTADVRVQRNIGHRLADVDAVESNQWGHAKAQEILGRKYKNTKKGREYLQKNITSARPGAYGRLLFKDDFKAKELVTAGVGIPDYRYTSTSKYKPQIMEARKAERGIWGRRHKQHPKRLMWEKQNAKILEMERKREEAGLGFSQKALSDTLVGTSEGSRADYLKKKKKGAAGGFIPNFANYKLRSGEKVSGAKLGSMRSSMSPADYDFAKANEVESAFAPAKAKTDPNMADAIYRTNQIVALVSNKMAAKKGTEFATGTKDAVSFSAAGTKSLSGGPVQVENIIAPYVYKAAEVVFQQMTNQMPVGGIKNIPDGLKKMAGSVFEAATQKMVGTTQFKGNQNLDMPVVTGGNKELLDNAFNTKGLTAMNAAEIKLGYNKALMQDVATKIIRSRKVPRGKGGPIDPNNFHGAGGFIPSFANLSAMSNTPAGKRALTTERALAGSSRMGFDSRVGYGVFNNSQGSLTNAVSQHLNSGDSMSSLASAGESAQAAVAAAALGFVPSFKLDPKAFTRSDVALPQAGAQQAARVQQRLLNSSEALAKAHTLSVRETKMHISQMKRGVQIMTRMGFEFEGLDDAAGDMKKALKKSTKAENKRDKETLKRERSGGRGGREKGERGGMGLAQVMAATFIAEQVSAFASGAVADETFGGQRLAGTISKTTTATTTGFALGSQIHPVVGVILGVGAGLGAFATSLDKASEAVDRLEFEAEKTAQINSEGNAALTHYINLLGQLNAETDPTKARKLEEQLGDALSQIADQSLRQQISVRATDMGGLRELEGGRGTSQRDAMLKQNLDMASAVEKNVRDGNFYTRELSQYATGTFDADDTDIEKAIKKFGGGVTEWFANSKFFGKGREGGDLTSAQLAGQQGQVMSGLDSFLSKVPIIGNKIAEKTAADTAKVAEIRARVGTQIAGTSDYEGSVAALKDISYRLAMADEGDMGALGGLTLGGLYKQMGIDESQIPAQFLGRIDEDLSTAGDDIEDVLQAIAKALEGKLTFERGLGAEIAQKNASKAAEDLKKRLDALKISPDEIFGKAVKAGQRRIRKAQATSKFMGGVESMQKTYIAGTAPDLASEKDKRAATLGIDKAAAARNMMVSLSVSSLKFQGKISEQLGKKDQNEDVVEALQAVHAGITNGDTLQEILTNQLVQGQTGVQELLKDQLAAQEAIRKSGERAQASLKLNNLLQRAQQAEKIRATTREKIGGGRIVSRDDRGKVLADLGTINRGRGSRGRGTEALFKEGEAYQNIAKRFKGTISEELQTKIEGGGRKLTTLGNVQDLTQLLAPGIKLGRAPTSSKEAIGRIIPMLEKRLSGETRVSSKQLLNSKLLLDALKQVQKSLQKSPESAAFEKFSQRLKYSEALQARPDLNEEMGIASLEQQRTGFVNEAKAIDKIVERSGEVRAKGRPQSTEARDNRAMLIGSIQKFIPGFEGEKGEKLLKGKTTEQLENALKNYSEKVSKGSAEKIDKLVTEMKKKNTTELLRQKALADDRKDLKAAITGMTDAEEGVAALGAEGGPISTLGGVIDALKQEFANGIMLTLEQAQGSPQDPEKTGPTTAKGATKERGEIDADKAVRDTSQQRDNWFKAREKAFKDMLTPFQKLYYEVGKFKLGQGQGAAIRKGGSMSAVAPGAFSTLQWQEAFVKVGAAGKDLKEAARWMDKYSDTRKRPGGMSAPVGNKARGSLGDAMARETRDIRNGVGGAIPGVDKPTLIPNFNGKPVVAHTGEHLVNNYRGGKSAIFNRQMVGSMGMPAGATQITAASGYIPNYVGGWGGMSQTWGGLGMIPKKLRKPTMKTIAGKGSGLQTRGRISMTPESAARMRAQGQALAKKGGAAATKAATSSSAVMGPSWFSTAKAYGAHQNVRLTQNPIHNPMTPVAQRFGRVRGLPGSPRLSGAVHPGSGGPGRIGPVARTVSAKARLKAAQEAVELAARKKGEKAAAGAAAKEAAKAIAKKGALKTVGKVAGNIGSKLIPGIGWASAAYSVYEGTKAWKKHTEKMDVKRAEFQAEDRARFEREDAVRDATSAVRQEDADKDLADLGGAHKIKMEKLAASGADWKTQRKEKSRLNKIKFAEIEKGKEFERWRAEKEAGTDTASIIAASKKHRESAGPRDVAARRSNLMIGDTAGREALLGGLRRVGQTADLGTDPYDVHLGKSDWLKQQRAKLGPRSEGQERRMKGHRADSSGMPWLHPDYKGPKTIGAGAPPQLADGPTGTAVNVGLPRGLGLPFPRITGLDSGVFDRGMAGLEATATAAQKYPGGVVRGSHLQSGLPPRTNIDIGMYGPQGARGGAGAAGPSSFDQEAAQTLSAVGLDPSVAQRQASSFDQRGAPPRILSVQRSKYVQQAAMRARAASLGGGVARSAARSKRKFGAAGSRRFGRRAEGFIPNFSVGDIPNFSMEDIPNFSMGEGLGSHGNASNEFLNFAGGGSGGSIGAAEGAAKAEEQNRMYRLKGSAVSPADPASMTKSSRQKHNVNVNIEVYGNVSEGAIDGIQSNSSDMATILEGLVNGGI